MNRIETLFVLDEQVDYHAGRKPDSETEDVDERIKGVLTDVSEGDREVVADHRQGRFVLDILAEGKKVSLNRGFFNNFNIEMPLNPNELPEIELETKVDVSHESHVYVHCYFDNTSRDMLIRIWKTTFLVDNGSGSRSKLVHVENISYAPQWTLIPDKKRFRFLLIFDALPPTCASFDLVEDIPQAGGFHIAGIIRNKTDVYHVDI